MTTPPCEPGWTTVGRSVLHEGWSTLVRRQVRLPSGDELDYEVDESVPFAAATLVIDGEYVILARQYRYPVDRWIYDLPAGGADAGEQPIETARRELEEELGLVAEDLRLLHTYFPNPGRMAWPVHVFVCTSTHAGTVTDDPAEQVRPARMSVVELDELIAGGEIVDPTLLIARTMAAVRGVLPPLMARDRGHF